MLKFVMRCVGSFVCGIMLAVTIVSIIMLVAITYQQPEFKTLRGETVTSQNCH